MTGPLVSIITPVYNGAKYLAQCVESVRRQTYRDWEYIIADNQSTDDTREIAERFASQDPRIRVLPGPDFVDMYANHNRALLAVSADSKYCKFVHADDWLYPECVERMVDVAERNPRVGIVGSFRLVDRHVESEVPLPYGQETMCGKEFIRWELMGAGRGRVTGSPTSVLLRMDLVRGNAPVYDSTIWHADNDTAYRFLLCSDFGFVHQVLTFTRMHLDASTPFSYRVWSFISFDGLLLIRYGPAVLTPAEYKTKVRQWLWRYGMWLAKQRVKPWRFREYDFFDFHRREITQIMGEPSAGRFLRATLAIYRSALLNPASR